MQLPDLLRASLALATTALVGRAWLALLPPGEPGRHAPRDLPATWAASHALGLASWLVTRSTLGAVGGGAALVWLTPAWILPAGIALVLRVATLPGAMVPRHDLPRAAESRAARVLEALTFAALILFLLRAQDDAAGALALGAEVFRAPGAVAVGHAHVVASVVLVEYAAHSARLPLVLGRGVQLALAALFAAFATHLAGSVWAPLALLTVLAAAGASAWVLRAERRSLALACVALAGIALLHPGASGVAAVALGALHGATAPNARSAVRRVAWLALVLPALARIPVSGAPLRLVIVASLAVVASLALGRVGTARVTPSGRPA